MARMCGLQRCEWIVFGNNPLVEREVNVGGWGSLDVHVIDGDCQGYNFLLWGSKSFSVIEHIDTATGRHDSRRVLALIPTDVAEAKI